MKDLGWGHGVCICSLCHGPVKLARCQFFFVHILPVCQGAWGAGTWMITPSSSDYIFEKRVKVLCPGFGAAVPVWNIPVAKKPRVLVKMEKRQDVVIQWALQWLLLLSAIPFKPSGSQKLSLCSFLTCTFHHVIYMFICRGKCRLCACV